jgi:hypothetical protein
MTVERATVFYMKGGGSDEVILNAMRTSPHPLGLYDYHIHREVDSEISRAAKLKEAWLRCARNDGRWH